MRLLRQDILAAALATLTGAPVEWEWPIGVLFGRWSSGQKLYALDLRYSEGISDAFEDVAISNRSWQLRFIAGVTLGSRD